jgi:hypothetical protein
MRRRPHRRRLPWGRRPGAAGPGAGRLGGTTLARHGSIVIDPTTVPDPLAPFKADTPGPDGVRRRLVERVRRLIAEGAYDTPARWRAAEERLFDRLADAE